MRRSAFVTALVLGIGAASVPQVNAEGFFEKLFGSSTSAGRQQQSRLGAPASTAADPRAAVTSAPWRVRAWPHRADRARDSRGREREASSSDEGTGQYQTYCVRTCDGYYFPISRAVPRRSFYRDAAACTARCGGEARLFYGPTDSDDKAAMVDLTGRVYGELPTAFKYRKSLVSGCACRPMPWSEAEVARHREYAMAEAEKNGGGKTVAATAPSSPDEASRLPPPVTGPGVLVMSAERDFIEQSQSAAALAAAAGLVPPTATAERPALAAAAMGQVPRGSVEAETPEYAGKNGDAGRNEIGNTRDAVPIAEPRQPEVLRSRVRSLRRAGAVEMINAAGTVVRNVRHERRQRYAASPHRTVAQAPSFFAKYVYPGR